MPVLTPAFSRHTQWEVQLPHLPQRQGSQPQQCLMRTTGTQNPYFRGSTTSPSTIRSCRIVSAVDHWQASCKIMLIWRQSSLNYNYRMAQTTQSRVTRYWIICRIWCRTYLHPTSNHPSKIVRCWDNCRWLVAIRKLLALKKLTMVGHASSFVDIPSDIVQRTAHKHIPIQLHYKKNGPRFESGRGRCVESSDKALYSHCPKEKPSH